MIWLSLLLACTPDQRVATERSPPPAVTTVAPWLLEGWAEHHLLTVPGGLVGGTHLGWTFVRRRGNRMEVLGGASSHEPLVALLAGDVLASPGHEVVEVDERAIRVRSLRGGALLRELMPTESLQGAALADLDGDGLDEIVWSSTTADDGRHWLTGQTFSGDELWRIEHDAGTLMAAELDGVPGEELVTESGLVLDPATGRVRWSWLLPFGSELSHGDVDGDGIDELLAWDGRRLWSFDVDRELPQYSWRLPHSGGLTAVAAADLDGDGSDEVLWVGRDGVSAGHLSTRTELWNTIRRGGSVLAGPAGVYVGTTSALEQYAPSDGQLTWRSRVDPEARQVQLGDVDGDGHPELLVSLEVGNSQRLSIYDADTWAFLGATEAFGSGDNISQVAAGDVDGDGTEEVLVGLYDSAELIEAVQPSPGPVDLELHVDPGWQAAHTVTWCLRDASGTVVAEAPPGTYSPTSTPVVVPLTLQGPHTLELMQEAPASVAWPAPEITLRRADGTFIALLDADRGQRLEVSFDTTTLLTLDPRVHLSVPGPIYHTRIIDPGTGPELILVDRRSRLDRYRPDGTPISTLAPDVLYPEQLHTTDLDQDGYPELVLVNRTGTVSYDLAHDRLVVLALDRPEASVVWPHSPTPLLLTLSRLGRLTASQRVGDQLVEIGALGLDLGLSSDLALATPRALWHHEDGVLQRVLPGSARVASSTTAVPVEPSSWRRDGDRFFYVHEGRLHRAFEP